MQPPALTSQLRADVRRTGQHEAEKTLGKTSALPKLWHSLCRLFPCSVCAGQGRSHIPLFRAGDPHGWIWRKTQCGCEIDLGLERGYMHSAKSSPRSKVPESCSSNAKRAQRQSCLQHLQSHQKPAQRTGHRRSSRQPRILQREIPPARDRVRAGGAHFPVCPRHRAAKLHEELPRTSTGRGEPKTSGLP